MKDRRTKQELLDTLRRLGPVERAFWILASGEEPAASCPIRVGGGRKDLDVYRPNEAHGGILVTRWSHERNRIPHCEAHYLDEHIQALRRAVELGSRLPEVRRELEALESIARYLPAAA